MKSSKAKELIDSSLEALSKSLEAGHSQALKEYLEVVGKFHEYSFCNTLLIWSQSPDATHVAGFQAWKKFKRFVKKGEKGIAIRAPIRLKRESEDKSESEPVSVHIFRIVYVFDISQTDGKPLPPLNQAQGDPGSFLLKIDKSIASKGIELSYSDSLLPLGVSKGGQIEVQAGLAPAVEFSVKVHELAHELLHHTEELRPKVQRELEAEAVSYVVSHWIGLDTNTAFSDYIQSYGADKETLQKSLETIRATSHQIIADLLSMS